MNLDDLNLDEAEERARYWVADNDGEIITTRETATCGVHQTRSGDHLALDVLALIARVRRLEAIVQAVADADDEDTMGARKVDGQYLRDAARAALAAAQAEVVDWRASSESWRTRWRAWQEWGDELLGERTLNGDEPTRDAIGRVFEAAKAWKAVFVADHNGSMDHFERDEAVCQRLMAAITTATATGESE